MSKENEHFSGSNSELAFVPSISWYSRRHSFRLPLRVIRYSIDEEAVSKEIKPLAQGTFPSKGPGIGGVGVGFGVGWEVGVGWGWGGGTLVPGVIRGKFSPRSCFSCMT